MARIARRALRRRDVPIFSLASPWSKISNSEGLCPLRLFEPRYVELARRIEPPNGEALFGYTEVSERKRAGRGMLLQCVGPFKWEGPRSDGPVSIVAKKLQPFRILGLRQSQHEHDLGSAETGGSGSTSSPPRLKLAYVQMLDDKDMARDLGRGRGSQHATSILGSTYIQKEGGVGYASYHFEEGGEAYISYENPLCAVFPNLDDGSRPPARKYFTCPMYDEDLVSQL